MSSTPIADMVAVMLAQGVSHDIIVLAIRNSEVATLPATLGNTLPVTRSRKAINQANYRARKSAAKLAKTGESVAMAAVPESATPPVTQVATLGNAADNAVTVAPLSILSSFELSQENPKEESKEVVPSIEPRVKAKRGARLPDDWQPSQIDIDFATARGLRLYEIEIEATKFRNYWTNRTDKQAAKPRWDRAWQNWILNVRPQQNGQGNGNGKSVLAAFDRLEQSLAGGDDYALRQDDLLRLPSR